MTGESLPDRLSGIVTCWSIVLVATPGPGKADSRAQGELLVRYGKAIKCYLVGALRDEQAAADLSQMFALNLVRGDFHNVDPGRGRFRDYVKTVLSHMVANYKGERAQSPLPLEFDVADPAARTTADEEDEARFLNAWRSGVLDWAWDALKEQEQNEGQPYYSLLRMKADDPDGELTSAEIAEILGSKLGRGLTPAGVRKQLERARKKFADLIIDGVIHSLPYPTLEPLTQELRVLGLLGHCRTALQRREPPASKNGNGA